MFNEVKDSGEREDFDTGARRDTRTGKGRYDLIPFIALERLARHYENGAAKYGENNFRKGIPLNRYVDSAFRHLIKWANGWQDEDHLAAVAWNIFAIIETEEMIKRGKLSSDLDDRWKPLLDDYSFRNGNYETFEVTVNKCIVCDTETERKERIIGIVMGNNIRGVFCCLDCEIKYFEAMKKHIERINQ